MPTKNPVRKGAPFDGTMFETFGDELAFVRDQPADRIWSLVQGDDGDLYVVSGYHLVNRLGYFVTGRPVAAHETMEIAVDNLRPSSLPGHPEGDYLMLDSV